MMFGSSAAGKAAVGSKAANSVTDTFSGCRRDLIKAPTNIESIPSPAAGVASGTV